MTATFETLVALDERLAAKGRPRLFAAGSFWATEAARFYGHPTAREWWAQIGRAGAKSTVIYRVAENETIFGDWSIPPGERHWATIKSRGKEEAAKGLTIIASDLDALGVRHTVAGDTIEIVDSPRGIRVVAASVAGTSGWRAFFDANDEAAKWPRDGAMAVDAREVFAGGRAMTATHAEARRLFFSSAYVIEGPHYEGVHAGDSERQVVSLAPTWIANPTVTEAQTRRLEPDPRIWGREFRNIPQASSSAAFDDKLVERALRTRVPDDWHRNETAIPIDAAGGGADEFTWGAARWCRQPGGDAAVLEIVDIDGVDGAIKAGISSDEIVRRIAGVARKHGASLVIGDQGERFALGAAFARLGLRFVSYAWTQPTKADAVIHFRSWLRDGRLSLPRDERLRAELLAYTEKASASGGFSYAGRGSSHDDRAALCLIAARADIEGVLRGTPSGPPIESLGLFQYYEGLALGLQGRAPTPLVVQPDPDDAVELRLPPRIAGTSVFMAIDGRSYPVEGGAIHVPRAIAGDVERTLRHAELPDSPWR